MLAGSPDKERFPNEGYFGLGLLAFLGAFVARLFQEDRRTSEAVSLAPAEEHASVG